MKIPYQQLCLTILINMIYLTTSIQVVSQTAPVPVSKSEHLIVNRFSLKTLMFGMIVFNLSAILVVCIHQTQSDINHSKNSRVIPKIQSDNRASINTHKLTPSANQYLILSRLFMYRDRKYNISR